MMESVNSVRERVCKRCDKPKLVNCFEINNRGAYRKICRDCRNEYFKTYNDGRREDIKNAGIKRKKKVDEIRKKLWGYFKEHPCVDCGERDPVVLDCDHVSGDKKAAISFMVVRAHSWDKIKEEINKCVVRCANCHRRKTAKERGFYTGLVDDESDSGVV